MRKKAQEKKRELSPSSSLSNSSSYSSVCTGNPTIDSMPMMNTTNEKSFYDTGGLEMLAISMGKSNKNTIKNIATSFNDCSEGKDGYISMDEIWKNIDSSEDSDIRPIFGTYNEITTSPIWDTLWMFDGQEEIGSNMFFPDNKRTT